MGMARHLAHYRLYKNVYLCTEASGVQIIYSLKYAYNCLQQARVALLSCLTK